MDAVVDFGQDDVDEVPRELAIFSRSPSAPPHGGGRGGACVGRGRGRPPCTSSRVSVGSRPGTSGEIGGASASRSVRFRRQHREVDGDDKEFGRASSSGNDESSEDEDDAAYSAKSLPPRQKTVPRLSAAAATKSLNRVLAADADGGDDDDGDVDYSADSYFDANQVRLLS